MSDVEEEGDNEVYAEGNTIFFFCDVDDDTIKKLCRLLKRVSLTHDNIKLCIKINLFIQRLRVFLNLLDLQKYLIVSPKGYGKQI